MKPLSLALMALGLSANVFAALPATTDPTLISVPQLPGGLTIGGSAFYLQPSISNGDLDYATFNGGSSPNLASAMKSIDPGYDWGWGVNLGYIFPNTGNDINLNYLHFDSDDSGSALTGNFFAGQFVEPINVIIESAPLTNAASPTSNYDLDQVDLTVGQYIDVGCRLIMHPNAGLRWADLQRKLNSYYFTPLTLVGNPTLGLAEKSDFQGIGPLAGLDASYYLGMGFGAVAHFDSALLIGDMDSQTNMATTNTFSFPPVNVFTFKSGQQYRMVPVIDAKLGADYTYVFNNTSQSDLTLEGGWMVSKYFNAVDRLQELFLPVIPPANIMGHKTSNFALQGPYVNLTLHI